MITHTAFLFVLRNLFFLDDFIALSFHFLLALRYLFSYFFLLDDLSRPSSFSFPLFFLSFNNVCLIFWRKFICFFFDCACNDSLLLFKLLYNRLGRWFFNFHLLIHIYFWFGRTWELIVAFWLLMVVERSWLGCSVELRLKLVGSEWVRVVREGKRVAVWVIGACVRYILILIDLRSLRKAVVRHVVLRMLRSIVVLTIVGKVHSWSVHKAFLIVLLLL